VSCTSCRYYRPLLFTFALKSPFIGLLVGNRYLQDIPVDFDTISDWAKGLQESGKLFWCDSEGKPFRTRVLENRAKKNSTAFLRCVTPAALPSPYDLTGDPSWLEGGALYELYDLDLEGVKASRHHPQANTDWTKMRLSRTARLPSRQPRTPCRHTALQCNGLLGFEKPLDGLTVHRNYLN